MDIPFNFTPRDYQLPVLKALDSGVKRAFCLWHRRAGKDKTFINILVKAAVERVGVYFYLLPTYTQAKKIIWDGIDNDGFKFIDHIPKGLIKKKNDQEMKIDLFNGSSIQLIGTDKYDALRGTNPVGCLFSEYAFHNPMAWEVLRPILKVNKGFAIFNTTPNGKNHAYDMWNIAEENEEWFSQKLTIKDTGVLDDKDMEEERATGMTEEMLQQEYFVSFDIGMIGSYYADEIAKAYKENRIQQLPFYKDKDIDIWFDLGMSDSTVMLFAQMSGQKINFINHYEANGKQLDYYFRYISEYIDEKKGKLGKIYMPHDSKQRVMTGKTPLQAAEEYFGRGTVEVIEIGNRMDGIMAARKMFARCYFDVENCKQMVRALENYHKEYDEVKKVFRDTPSHDWASHTADAFRYVAMTQNKMDHYEDSEEAFEDLLNFEI